MQFSEVDLIVGAVPFILKTNARYLYDLVLKEKPQRILELGVAHGTATCYIAAALQEIGSGKIICVDLLEAKEFFHPSPEEQLEKSGLSDFAEIIRMQTGYSWFLHDEIRRNTVDSHCNQIYDLCIIDGPKNWTIDGAAFFFADKLIKQNGWIIFDDYNWTYAMMENRREATDGITHRLLSQVERETPHIREIFELLVKQHPDYSNFLLLENSNWALAQKTSSAQKIYTIRYKESYKDIIAWVYRKIRGFLQHHMTKR